MPILELDDISLHYTERPALAGAVSGPDLLLLHGFGVSSRVWEPMLPFVHPGRRVVALDARGHGQSGSNGLFSLDDNVDDALAVVDRLALDRPVVVGSSIGAVYATEIVSRAADRVSGAVLVGGIGRSFATMPDVVDANLAMVDGLCTDFEATVADVVPSWFGPMAGPHLYDWVAGQFADLRTDAAAVVKELVDWDPRPMLPRIDLPMHYIHGRHDGIPVSVPRECAALSKQATVTIAEHAGHMPHIECPGWVAGLI